MSFGLSIRLFLWSSYWIFGVSSTC